MIAAVCNFDAETLWRIQQSFDMDATNALKDNRELTRLSETMKLDESGQTVVNRVVSCKILRSPLPEWTKSWIDVETVMPTVHGEWYRDLFDEDHGYTFTITTTHPKAQGKFTVSGKQWIVPGPGEDKSTLHTRVVINVNVPVVGTFVEQSLASEMTKSYKKFPDLVDAYVAEFGIPSNRTADKAQQTDDLPPMIPEQPYVHRMKRSWTSTRWNMRGSLKPIRLSTEDTEEQRTPRPPCWRTGLIAMLERLLSCLRPTSELSREVNLESQACIVQGLVSKDLGESSSQAV